MVIKVVYCEKCDFTKFPGAIKADKPCSCCQMSKYSRVVRIEIEKVTA